MSKTCQRSTDKPYIVKVTVAVAGTAERRSESLEEKVGRDEV